MNQIENEKLYLEYLAMGDDRTLAKLSEKTGRTKDSLYKISAKNGWKQRIRTDSIALKENLNNPDISGLSASEILSAISRNSLEKLYKVIATIKVSNVRDAKTLLELSQLAAGKPTEITQTNQDSDEQSLDLYAVITETLPKEWAYKLLDRIVEVTSEEYFD